VLQVLNVGVRILAEAVVDRKARRVVVAWMEGAD
jgi:hypothetical protein